MPELNISREKVAFLIDKAQEFDVKDLPAELESRSNASDSESATRNRGATAPSGDAPASARRIASGDTSVPTTS